MQDGNYRRTRAAQIAALLYPPMAAEEGPYAEFEDGIPDASATPYSQDALQDVNDMRGYLRPLMPQADDAVGDTDTEPMTRQQALQQMLMRRG